MGFLFDIYVVLVGPLILQPALTELAKSESRAHRNIAIGPATCSGFHRSSVDFAACGADYLADRFGRRRILTYSILVYALLRHGFRTRRKRRIAAAVPHALLRRYLRRICRGGGVARRTISRSEDARGGARLHAGLLVARRRADRRRVLRRESLGLGAARDLRKPLRLALCA